MLETIYTIPINEAFDKGVSDKSSGCPFCNIRKKVEDDQLEIILGASMMEPDIRIKTNEQGFCHRHYEKMFTMKNRLGLALMMESHLAELQKDFSAFAPTDLIAGKGAKVTKRIDALKDSCYICERVDYTMNRMYSNAALLWEQDRDFVNKTKEQPYFCLHHFREFLEAGRNNIDKKKMSDFYSDIKKVEMDYFATLSEDVSWFCKKFDYRYENEDWKNSKDAVERTIKFLTGED